jgi:integrin beta 3
VARAVAPNAIPPGQPPPPVAPVRASAAAPVRPAASREAVDGTSGVPPLDRGRSLSASLTAGGTEIRRQMRDKRFLRVAAMVGVILVVLGALPLYFGIRAAVRDPVFDSLDSLGVEPWAAQQVTDRIDGSRLCIGECRFRERIAHSEKDAAATAQEYAMKLDAAGWQVWEPVADCPEQPVPGQYSCWRRDELTLDLWVRPPACPDPNLLSSAAPSAPAVPDAADCSGADVSIKVRNAIGDPRTGPQPSVDPSLVGETPDPIFTEDPLPGPSPAPS